MRVDDLYPVRVFVGSEQLGRARVVTRDGIVRAFVDSGKRVDVAREGTLVELARVNGSEWTFVVDVNGVEEEWTLRRAGGCGCGTRLKAMDVDAAWST